MPQKLGTAALQHSIHLHLIIDRYVVIVIGLLSDFFMVLLSSFLTLFHDDDFLQCYVGVFSLSYIFIDFRDFPQHLCLWSLALLDSVLTE